jgi:predicted membrane protein (TIGR00267 family)
MQGSRGARGWSQLWRVARAEGIARRYFVVNGFDGALTMLGICTGFYLGSGTPLRVVLQACLGAAIALTMSGLSSAYLSESAERRRWLAQLQQAMISDLAGSSHALSARLVPWVVAAVNGLAPLAISLLIMLPIWLAYLGVDLPLPPLPAAILIAFACLFGLGVYLARIEGGYPIRSGIRTLLLAAVTVGLIVLIGAPA